VLEDTALWWRRVRCGNRLIETAWNGHTDCGGYWSGGGNEKTLLPPLNLVFMLM
jgi:hypothetical protein